MSAGRILGYGVATTLVVGGFMATQGEYETQPLMDAEGMHLPITDYTLDDESLVGRARTALDESESPEGGLPENGTPLTVEQMGAIVTDLNTDVQTTPHCPEFDSEYSVPVVNAPNANICLGAVQVQPVEDGNAFVFSTLLNPEAVISGVDDPSAFDVAEAFDGASEEDCESAKDRLKGYGESLVSESSEMPGGHTAQVLIIGGDTCTDFTPPVQRPRPPQ